MTKNTKKKNGKNYKFLDKKRWHMGANKYFLILAILGVLIWNLPFTASNFAGTHTYYNGAAPCTKCHNVDIETHTGTTAHDNFTCTSCHRSEPGIIYQSKGIAGNMAHAASMGSCANCHYASPFSTGNVAITAELEVLSVEPSNATIDSDIQMVFNDGSGGQSESPVCTCNATLMQGDTHVIVVSNVTNGRFDVTLLLNGTWSNATLNLRVYGTGGGNESFIINATGSPFVYTTSFDWTPAPGLIPVPTQSPGDQLYATYCSSCHGAIASFSLGGTVTQISTGIINVPGMTSCCSLLNMTQVQLISDAILSATAPVPTPTPPPPGDIGTPMPNPTFRFVAWGDTKGGTNVLETESKSIANNNLNPAFTLYAGDLCDSGPDTACFNVRKDAFSGDLSGVTNNGIFDKTFAIRGNHDSSGGSVWQSGFNFNGVASSIGATNYVEQTLDMTYSFDYDNSHFVGIDNPCGSLNDCAGDITTAQINWLDQDLTNAENRGMKHAFLLWHGPAYPVDGHCCGGVSAAMITVLNKHPIISAGFFGHEHVVEYTHLDSSIIPSLSCSFEQVISGAAGAGLYSTTGGRAIDYYLGQMDGYTIIGVSGNDFDVSFYKADGTRTKTLSFTETGTCQ